MPARSFDLLRAYMETEPRGEERMDWRFGALASVVANYAGKESAKDVTADDMRLKFVKPDPKKNDDKAILAMWKLLYGKKKAKDGQVTTGKKIEGPKGK